MREISLAATGSMRSISTPAARTDHGRNKVDDRLQDLIHEIEACKRQIDRQRRDITTLKTAGRASAPAELLLERMCERAARLRHERDRLKKSAPSPNRGRASGVRIG
jgi:chromosome segregation ATPase